MTITLSNAALRSLDPRVQVPRYDRAAVRPGIAHIGVGGFHRAHQAVYVDDLLAAGATDWGIVGIGLLPGDRRMRDVLRDQDHLYTVVTKQADGRLEPRVIGSIVDYRYGPDNPEAVLQVLIDPAIRIVSLTVTEGGYHLDHASGELVVDAALQADLDRPGTPATAFGHLVEALARRRTAGTEAFTVSSCDNLPGNGDLARRMLTAFARLRDPDLADWIDRHVAFPNSMVDRITPVTNDEDRALLTERFGLVDGWPVVCEPFRQWVCEDRFPAGRPAYETVGVQVVDDVVPYELMKLRLLNAAHQALGHLGRLRGWTYAHEAAQDPPLVRFVADYLREEGAPTLPPVPGIDLEHYQRQLLDRFANPAILDTLDRLCVDSSDRIPAFVLPVVRDQLRRGGSIAHCATIVAAWAAGITGDSERAPFRMVDQHPERVTGLAQHSMADPAAFLDDAALFGPLAHDPRFVAAFSDALSALRTAGVQPTLEQLSITPSTPSSVRTER